MQKSRNLQGGLMRTKDREITNITDIKEILDSCKTCHVAMVDKGEPYLVPLSYGYWLEGNTLTLYFHSAKEGRKLDVWHVNNKVCFEICREGEPVHAETPCNSGYYYSSLIGRGEVVFIEDSQEKSRALGLMFEHQTGKKVDFSVQQTQTVCVFKITAADFTGKRKAKPEK